MRVIFALPVSILAWLAPAQAQTADWQTFKPPGGGFQPRDAVQIGGEDRGA